MNNANASWADGTGFRGGALCRDEWWQIFLNTAGARSWLIWTAQQLGQESRYSAVTAYARLVIGSR
jgi:hypothetical protein